MAIAWAVVAAFMGLKGIQYVAKVATFLPLLPLAILIILFVSTMGGLNKFEPKAVIEAGAAAKAEMPKLPGEDKPAVVVTAKPALGTWPIMALLCTYIVGFFATAGAAGTDFGMNNRDGKDVQLGGLVGIAGATIFAGCLALLIVAGAHGAGKVGDKAIMDTTSMMGDIMGSKKIGSVMMYLIGHRRISAGLLLVVYCR